MNRLGGAAMPIIRVSAANAETGNERLLRLVTTATLWLAMDAQTAL